MSQQPTQQPTYIPLQNLCVRCHHNMIIYYSVPGDDGGNAPSPHPAGAPFVMKIRALRQKTLLRLHNLVGVGQAGSPQEGIYYNTICERCGVDNEAYLHLRQTHLWHRFTKYIGYLLVAAVVLAVARLSLDRSDPRGSVTLVLLVLIAGFVPLLFIPDSWPQVRIFRHRQKIQPSLRYRPSPQVLLATLIFVVLVIVVPFLLFAVYPSLESGRNLLFGREEHPTEIDERFVAINQALAGGAASQTGNGVAPINWDSANNALLGLHQLRLSSTAVCNEETLDFYAALLLASGSTNADLIKALSDQIDTMRADCRRDLLKSVVSSMDNMTAPEPALPSLILEGIPFCFHKGDTVAGVASEQPVAAGCQLVIVNYVKNALQADPGYATNSSAGMGGLVPAYNPGDWKGNIQQAYLYAVDPSLSAKEKEEVEVHLSVLEDAIVPLETPKLNWVKGQLLFDWVFAIGTATVIGTACAFLSLNHQISYIDPLLPQPLFTSLNRMKQVTEWEINQTVLTSADHTHIQWMQVRRSDHGGVKLTGLHRAHPRLDAQGRPTGTMVRAQKYVVTTDLWARIQKVYISDVEVPHSLPAGEPPRVEVTPRLILSAAPPAPAESPKLPARQLAELSREIERWVTETEIDVLCRQLFMTYRPANGDAFTRNKQLIAEVTTGGKLNEFLEILRQAYPAGRWLPAT